MYHYDDFLLFALQNGTLCDLQGFGVYFVSACVSEIVITFKMLFLALLPFEIETYVHSAFLFFRNSWIHCQKG